MDHAARIKKQLIEAGVTRFGLAKMTSRNLPKVIHADEQIRGVVYGLSEASSVMLVATDKRLIYMDHKPFFSVNDEINYDFVSGVSLNTQGHFAAVVVHTRAGEFNIRFANKICAENFVKYIESRGIERPADDTTYHKSKLIGQSSLSSDPAPKKPITNDRKTEQAPIKPISKEVKDFVLSKDTCVLSTMNAQNGVNAAIVHYIYGADNSFYIVTKNRTQKAQNITKNPLVALTIFDVDTRRTVQMEGRASVVSDEQSIKEMTGKILRPRRYGNESAWPPITLLIAGDYVVIHVVPTSMKFLDYS